MTAQEHLAKYNVSTDTAKSFILDNLDNLSLIFDTCKNFNVNSEMISEILDMGFDSNAVSNYFTNNGFNGVEIDLANGFTQNWLNDKVLYGVFDWDTAWTYSETTFTNNIISYKDTIDGDFEETYFLNNNNSIHVETGEGSFDWNILEITNSYIKVTPQAGSEDYLFFDQTKALEFFDQVA